MGYICPICFDDLTSPLCPPCGHILCKKCLTDYNETQPDPLKLPCPICKAPFSEAMINNLPQKYLDYLAPHIRTVFLPEFKNLLLESKVEDLQNQLSTIKQISLDIKMYNTQLNDLLHTQRNKAEKFEKELNDLRQVNEKQKSEITRLACQLNADKSAHSLFIRKAQETRVKELEEKERTALNELYHLQVARRAEEEKLASLPSDSEATLLSAGSTSASGFSSKHTNRVVRRSSSRPVHVIWSTSGDSGPSSLRTTVENPFFSQPRESIFTGFSNPSTSTRSLPFPFVSLSNAQAQQSQSSEAPPTTSGSGSSAETKLPINNTLFGHRDTGGQNSNTHVS
ncbi:hypothetical protein C8Q75DRAFT_462869 [Abortiporus biennis]|nr:hypothetical protein C8Q75DRAFT_462869 [Abortiporus biennis]